MFLCNSIINNRPLNIKNLRSYYGPVNRTTTHITSNFDILNTNAVNSNNQSYRAVLTNPSQYFIFSILMTIWLGYSTRRNIHKYMNNNK